MVPLGTMVAGVGTDLVGAPITLGVMGFFLFGLAIVAGLIGPGLSLRRPQPVAPSRQLQT